MEPCIYEKTSPKYLSESQYGKPHKIHDSEKNRRYIASTLYKGRYDRPETCDTYASYRYK